MGKAWLYIDKSYAAWESKKKPRQTMKVFISLLLLIVVEGNENSWDLENIVQEIKNDLKLEMETTFERTLQEMQYQLQQTTHELGELRLAREVLHKDTAKQAPFSFFCAAAGVQYDMSRMNRSITYEAVTYSSTNVEGSSLDKFSGAYTSGLPGTYTVTWSLVSSLEPGNSNTRIILRKNGAKVYESTTVSWNGGADVESKDQGGRTLYLHLDRGETLDLFCEDCSPGIGHVTFCVSLAQSDVA